MLAAGRILPWHKAKPGGEVAATAELPHIRRKGGNGHCADRPDPRHCLQPARGVVFLGRSGDTLVQPPNFGTDLRNLVKVEPCEITHKVREWIAAETLFNTRDIGDTLTDDDPMFGQMSA